MTQLSNTKFSKDSFEFNLISGEVLYYDENHIERNITLNAVIVANYTELKKVPSPKYNAVYITLDSKNVYAFTTHGWLQIFTHAEVQKVISHIDDLTPSILLNEDGDYIGPVTTIGNVFDDNTSQPLSMADILGDDHLLRTYKADSRYVEAQFDNQREFIIPFPYAGYDFTKNHMNVVIDNRVVETSKYVIQGDSLILLANNGYQISRGQLILFIFFYTTSYDLNKNVVLGTHNLADGCVTTDKLSSSISIKASNIMETPVRLFFTPEERAKLRGLNSKNYVHPETHPASMITETDDKKWLTPKEIDYWNNKANQEDTYTKKEVVSKIYEILNTEDLTAFNKIAKALGEDPNFATTILNHLAEKATKDELGELKKDVDKKVYSDNYIANPIYDMSNKFTSDGIDYYTVHLADDNFKEYVDGMGIILKVGETNGNHAMIRVNDLPYKKIKTVEQFELIKGELKKDSIYHLRYNGTVGNFILQGKGGVKITDASLKKYVVGPDGDIMRGNPVDINRVDNTINVSRFIIDPLINLDTKIKGNNPENIFVDFVDDNNILVTWIDNQKVFAMTYAIKNGYIYRDAESKISVLQDKCAKYTISKLHDGIYCAIFVNKDIITKKIIPVSDGKLNLDQLAGEIDRSTGEVTDLMFLQCGNGYFVLAYTHSNVTQTILYKFNEMEKRLIEVSERNNLDYPIDRYQKVNPNQILFVGNYLNTLIGWVLTVDNTDFYNSTTVQISLVNPPAEDNTVDSNIFNDIKLLPLTDNRALLEYELDGIRMRKVINVIANGELEIDESSSYDEDVLSKKHHSNIHKRTYIPFIDTYLSASNYDKELDTMTGDGTTIKLLLEREGNNSIFYTINKNNQFLINESLTIHDIRLKSNNAILAYFNNKMELRLILLRLLRKPDGIAIGDAKVTEECQIYKF